MGTDEAASTGDEDTPPRPEFTDPRHLSAHGSDSGDEAEAKAGKCSSQCRVVRLVMGPGERRIAVEAPTRRSALKVSVMHVQCLAEVLYLDRACHRKHDRRLARRSRHL